MGASKQLFAAVHVRVVGLPQGQEHQVRCQGCSRSLGHGQPTLSPSRLMLNCIHIFDFHFFAAVMQVPWLRTSQVPPHPDLLDM